MPAPAKSERRGPKPRKPIKRSTTPIKRRSRPAAVRRTSSGKAKHAADIAWSKAVRAKGPCIARGIQLFDGMDVIHHRCDDLTAAHVISRRYLATRHDLDNGVPLCFSAHDFFTRNPERWIEFISIYLGAEKYEELRTKALKGNKLP